MYMMKFPSKLYNVSESVIGKMSVVISMIPDNGIDLAELYQIASKTIHTSDFIDALDCMYSIATIYITPNHIIYKQC